MAGLYQIPKENPRRGVPAEDSFGYQSLFHHVLKLDADGEMISRSVFYRVDNL